MEARPPGTVLHRQPWMSVQPGTQYSKYNPTTNTCMLQILMKLNINFLFADIILIVLTFDYIHGIFIVS